MAAQPGFCRTWSETPKTCFLMTRLILYLYITEYAEVHVLFNAYLKMRFLCIFFAAGISIASLAMLDTIATQVKRYEKLDEFLANVKTTADSWLDYVSKIQAFFCPNQPVCGAEGELERKDVLGTLPAELSVRSLTLNIEDVANSVDVCCLPCSCSDSCRRDDNCCPTKQMFPDISK